MKLTFKEKRKIRRRIKLWNLFGWGSKGKGFSFFKDHRSLNCGCAHCKGQTFMKRYENRQDRRKARRIIEEELTHA